MFTASATRLAGLSGALLGWRPDEFWAATPVELASIITALCPPSDGVADSHLLAHLKELFPDG
ncbi:MAG: phage tail assembly chaperone [Chakrabartia sp.]